MKILQIRYSNQEKILNKNGMVKECENYDNENRTISN